MYLLIITDLYIITKQKYHIFQKQKILKGGRRVYRWYYYFFDNTGKMVQRACSGCTSRTTAENYVRGLVST